MAVPDELVFPLLLFSLFINNQLEMYCKVRALMYFNKTNVSYGSSSKDDISITLSQGCD